MPLVLEHLGYVALVFTRHLTLLFILLLVGAILAARLGRSFGVDRLFWHEQPLLQFRAGTSVGLLFAKVGFVGYLLDERALRALPHFARVAPHARPLAAALYILLLVVPTAVAWLALAALARRAGRAPAGARVRRLPLLLGVLTALCGSIGLLALFARYVPAEPALPAWLIRILWLHELPPDVRPLHLLAALFMALLSAEYVVYAFTRRGFTPAMAVCTLLGLVAGAVGFLEFRAWNQSAIALAFLASAWLGGFPRYKLRVQALSAHYRSPVPLEHYPSAPLAGSAEPVRSEQVPWRSEQGKQPLVLVCASGGGLRAALWTAEVLSELEQQLPGFAPSLRIIAGASGGMLGGSYYALTLLPRPKGAAGFAHTLSRRELVENLGRDGLSAPIKRLVFRDLPLSLLPLANHHDRGEALESCWLSQLGPQFDQRFGDLLERERRGELPSLVFTPMLVEDGRRLLISNLDLSFLTENELEGEGCAKLLSRSSFELSRLFPAAFPAFPVRTAARLSAAFPYVSPAVSLPTVPRRRVVDAGYYDNYGVNVCAAWLADCFCDGARRRWLEHNVSRILVVQIRDFVSPLQGVQFPAEAPKSPLSRGLEGLLSPLHGALSSRESVSVFRNDEQLEQLVRLYDAAFAPGFLRTEIFEYRGAASLSWYLTEGERSAISASARELAPQLSGLQKFWHGELPAASPQVGKHVAHAPEQKPQVAR